MTPRLQLVLCAGALAIAASLPAPVQAQTPPATSRATITHVKPDMLNEWLDLQRNEVVPALKKGGAKGWSGWRPCATWPPCPCSDRFVLAIQEDTLSFRFWQVP